MIIPDWKLERYVLGELPGSELAALSERVHADGELARRVAEIEASNREILVRYPVRRVAPAIRQQARLPAARARTPWLLAGPLLAAALLLLFLRPPTSAVVADLYNPGLVTDKGAPALFVYRRLLGGKAELLGDGGLAAPGDVLQLSYRAGTLANGRPLTHGVVLSIDGRGSVTLHWPRPGQDTVLGQDGTIALSSAYKLDDAPDFERFFLVSSTRAVDAGVVETAALALALEPERAQTEPLPLPDDYHQSSKLVRKTP